MKKSKWRFIWLIAIALLTITSIPKILSLEFMVNNMQQAGMGHMTFWVGVIELMGVIIFLIPKTRKIGFLLLTAFAGGIIASEWAAQMIVIPGILVQSTLWIGMYFEAPEIFKLKKS